MAALSIVTTKFVAIGLSVELAGHYNTSYGYLQLFGILADFGLYAVAVREVSKSLNKKKTLGALLTLRICILLLSLGAAIVYVWFNPSWKHSPLPLAVSIAAFVPFFTLLAGILRTIFQVEYKMHFVFVAEVLQRVLTVTLTGLILYFGVRGSTNPDVLFLMLGIGGIGAALLFALSALFSQKILAVRPSFDWQEICRILSLSTPYGLAFLCTALYRQFDVTLIAELRTDYAYQNAAYGFVQRMMDMAYLLPTFLLNSTLPMLSERDARGEETKDLVGKTLLVIFLIGSISGLFGFFWARPLVSLLTTEQYLSHAGIPGSDTALTILAGSMFLNGFVLFSFYSLLTKHRWRPLVLTLFVGVVCSITLNLTLIPTLGFVGASITSLLTHLLLVMLLLPQALRILPVHLPWNNILRGIIFVALLALGLVVLHPLLTSDFRTAVGLIFMTIWMMILGWGTGLLKMARAR
jgi:O-antigen/teichoic acid export membrane protein